MTPVSVSPHRLAELLVHLGEVGWDAAHGMDRLAFSAADIEVRRRLIDVATGHGFTVAADDIGNLLIERPGGEADRPLIACGSHLDAQPGGGRFDGAAGVIAGLEVLLALAEHDVVTRHPVGLYVWGNEEGARFAPTTMGSAVFAGVLALDAALAAKDASGTTAGDAIDEMHRALGLRPRALETPGAYVELHIEQGPTLDTAGVRLGVVTGVQGIAWLQATFVGDARHAGTTPHDLRRDAAAALARAITELEGWRAREADEDLRLTCGRLEVWPNTPNTVPGRARLTVDVRHPARRRLDAAVDAVRHVLERTAGSVDVTVAVLQHEAPTRFDPAVVAAIRAAADELGVPTLQVVSGATHDAVRLARRCPTGMVFIPCRDGVSHDRAELATVDDIALGAQVLAGALLELAT